MDKVVHFEIPFDDKKRAHDFYSKVFGWKLQDIPEMDYTIARTTEVDAKMMPLKTRAINGGMFKRVEGMSKTPVLVINVNNIDESLKHIEKSGGKLFSQKRNVGNMGLYALVKDTEGNIIGVWESLPAHNNK